jgi:chromosomal replication initiation ATPase DnaA
MIIDIKTIEKAACEAWNIPLDRLYERTRKRDFSDPRKVVFNYRMRVLKQSDTRIEEETGFDRTTVRSAANKMPDLLFDKDFADKYNMFLAKLTE